MKSGEIRFINAFHREDSVTFKLASECLDLRRRLARALRELREFDRYYILNYDTYDSPTLEKERAELRERRGR